MNKVRQNPKMLPDIDTVSVAGVLLAAGRGEAARKREHRSISAAGVSVGVLLSGNVDVTFGGQHNEHFGADAGFLLSCDEPIEMIHAVQPAFDTSIVSLIVTDNDLASQLQHNGAAALYSDTSWRFNSWKPTAAILAVARQINFCPYVGQLRELYLQGKTLELLSLVIAAMGASDLSGSDGPKKAERILEAHAILTAEYRAPPTLDTLAKRVGLCTSVLTASFRRAFGVSVTEFVQELRLKSAHDALLSGEQSVAQAAYSIGLTPAYFSTIFRRRYGVSPSTIGRRGPLDM